MRKSIAQSMRDSERGEDCLDDDYFMLDNQELLCQKTVNFDDDGSCYRVKIFAK